MTELARFSEPGAARALVQVLQDHGIAARVEAVGADYRIQLEQPGQEEDARALLALFRANPDDPRFRRSLWETSEPAAPAGDQPPLFSGGWLASMGWVTRVVLFACVAIFLSPLLMGTVLYEALMFPEQWQQLASQPWRLVTPMLLHFSALHIIFNMLWWSELGRIVEGFQSSLQLVWVTLFTGVLANLAQYLVTGPRFGGMSGVVYGLLGYLWIYGRVNPAAGYGLRREIVLFMLAWLVICFVGLADIVANYAHLGGLLSGCLLGAVTGLWRRRRYYSG